MWLFSVVILWRFFAGDALKMYHACKKIPRVFLMLHVSPCVNLVLSIIFLAFTAQLSAHYFQRALQNFFYNVYKGETRFHT